MDPASTALFSGFWFDIDVMGISQSAAQGEKIAAARILRRSPRSTSSCTAPEVQQEYALQKDGQSVPKRRQQLKRRSAARLKKERPLSEDPIHYAKRPARPGHRAGSKILTQAAPPASEGISLCKSPPTLHACSCVTDYMGDLEYPFAADALLSLARRSVRMHTDSAGRRPCVMDVILDLQDRVRHPTVPEARVAAYAVAAVRCNYGQCSEDARLAGLFHGRPSWVQEYCTCDDQMSLAQYWNDQAARWADMQLFDVSARSGMTALGFPESIERSTARWTTNNGGGDDVISICNGRGTVGLSVCLLPNVSQI